LGRRLRTRCELTSDGIGADVGLGMRRKKQPPDQHQKSELGRNDQRQLYGKPAQRATSQGSGERHRTWRRHGSRWMRAAPEAVDHLPDAACRCVSEDISGSRQESKDAIV